MEGKVFLVGAGPGDPGLLTIKAAEIIRQADSIVYDRLANPEILELARDDAELIDVGKEPDSHPVPQEEINEILVEKALEGKRVVRLKGGDPFVFGRGGEEALFLAKNDIPFEVISGITSAIAVPAYAGIPVTHREMSSALHIFTGHGCAGKRKDIDWKILSKLDGTLIFLMGINNIDHIVENLLMYGKSPETPIAVIMEGTTPYQKTVSGTLSDILEKAKATGIKNPALIVVGDVVNLSRNLDWYEMGLKQSREKKLSGKRILVTGIFPEEDGIKPETEKEEIFLLKDEGAEVIHCPVLKISPVYQDLEELLEEIESYDLLVFTGKNGVESFIKALRKKRFDIRRLKSVRIAATGARTRQILEEHFLYPDIVPEEYTSANLLEMLREEKSGKNAAVVTSDIGGEKLVEGLKRAGFKARKVVAYKNEPNYEKKEKLMKELDRGIDIAIFTSPSTFRYLQILSGEAFEKIRSVRIAAIGPTTKKAIENEGFKVDIMPEEHTFEGIIREILKRRM
ncbi:MAG: uroporphyrinogen methyltransferase / synthase [Thermoanaerobacteraceae bacterium]|jgi:uroporphyrinogen III methyltransferase/synthase|nr:uroporphyrinogen methyltransferase / synthase [Thermoanaerobacteraceae bacterium]